MRGGRREGALASSWRCGAFNSSVLLLGRVSPGAQARPDPRDLLRRRPPRAPPRSKPDQTGEIHCPFSVVLTYHPDDPINAAAALRDIELRRAERVVSSAGSLSRINHAEGPSEPTPAHGLLATA